MRRDPDLSAYLAGELEASERARVEEHLATDPRLAAEVAALRELGVALARLPPEAWALIDADAAASPPPRPRWAPRRLGPRALTALGAAATLAVGVIVGALLGRTPAPSGRSVALAPLVSPAAGVRAKATVTTSGQIIIAVSRLPAPDPRHYYEAWLMSSASELVALGAFRTGADGHATLQTALPVGVHSYRYIDISLQQVGAGPGHSSASVLRGPTRGL